jgi:hypothetical protein
MARYYGGFARLVRSFSWPGGLPSHLSPLHPRVIHEGGELGYALAESFGAAFDNPDLVVACIVGDGEFETGATATAWHSTKFLNSATNGAVLPLQYRLVTSIGAMAAAAGGSDALIFTGGIGERSPRVRHAAAANLAFLGIALRPANDTTSDSDANISAYDAHVATLVIHDRESLNSPAKLKPYSSADDTRAPADMMGP